MRIKAIFCPVCKSKSIKPFLNARGTHGKDTISREIFTYYVCNICQVIFLVGINFDAGYYKKYYFFTGNPRTSFLGEIEKFITGLSYNYKQKIILSSVTSPNKTIRVLDVGCGQGGFLKNLDDRKFEKFGIELDRKEYQICKNKNLNVYSSDIMNMDFKGNTFDAITLWHVIEHIPHPVKLFVKLDKLLKKGGKLFISTPNTSSFGFKIALGQWFHMDAPRHVILYNSFSMLALCKDSSFEVEKIQSERFEFPLDLLWSLKGQYKYFYPLYPIIKGLDSETLLFVLKKK
jgi:SAM-dependent methyltransferase